MGQLLCLSGTPSTQLGGGFARCLARLSRRITFAIIGYLNQIFRVCGATIYRQASGPQGMLAHITQGFFKKAADCLTLIGLQIIGLQRFKTDNSQGNGGKSWKVAIEGFGIHLAQLFVQGNRSLE
jgi:hypothetical protein